jgi:hypothetical protein
VDGGGQLCFLPVKKLPDLPAKTRGWDFGDVLAGPTQRRPSPKGGRRRTYAKRARYLCNASRRLANDAAPAQRSDLAEGDRPRGLGLTIQIVALHSPNTLEPGERNATNALIMGEAGSGTTSDGQPYTFVHLVGRRRVGAPPRRNVSQTGARSTRTRSATVVRATRAPGDDAPLIVDECVSPLEPAVHGSARLSGAGSVHRVVVSFSSSRRHHLAAGLRLQHRTHRKGGRPRVAPV